jgi:hypothetical protein
MGECVRLFKGHRAPVTSTAISGCGKLLASVSGVDGTGHESALGAGKMERNGVVGHAEIR